MSEAIVVRDDGAAEETVDISHVKTEPLPEVAVEVVEQPQPAEQQPAPTIHDKAHWDRVNDYLAERWSALKTTAMQERTAEEVAEWDVYLYDMMRYTLYFVEQLALERQPVPEAPKPARKRTPKVPKAAMPATETPESSDAA